MTLSFVKDKREIKALRRYIGELKEELRLANEELRIGKDAAGKMKSDRDNEHKAAMLYYERSESYRRELDDLHGQLQGVSVALGNAEADCLIWKNRALALESRIKALIAQYESALNFTEVEEIFDAE